MRTHETSPKTCDRSTRNTILHTPGLVLAYSSANVATSWESGNLLSHLLPSLVPHAVVTHYPAVFAHCFGQHRCRCFRRHRRRFRDYFRHECRRRLCHERHGGGCTNFVLRYAGKPRIVGRGRTNQPQFNQFRGQYGSSSPYPLTTLGTRSPSHGRTSYRRRASCRASILRIGTEAREN